ncbi:unnamed protein product [Mycena citricolor]|uniref:NADH:flavin oxidoreductase/NADH oxidase N-terminal domain-containing protein n=1 Tax=Mycena citricolor TaxID=2018698 RepID=A0AAD2H2E8_9AGAR|nr:unnamed protein product [Mycena citricolor]
MLEYYVQRAKGGTGFIVTEGTLPSRQGTEWPNAPGIFNQAPQLPPPSRGSPPAGYLLGTLRRLAEGTQ